MDQTEKTIHKLYDHLGFYDMYTGSLLFFILITLVVFLTMAYFYMLINFQPIQDNWQAQRCHPYVIPFAGLINKPDNKGIMEFTEENFSYCVQNVLTNVTGYLVEPLTYVTSDLTGLYDHLTDSLNDIRTYVSNFRTNIANIATEIMGRLANIMVPLQSIIIKFRDFMQKLNGVMAATLYTVIGSFSALISLFGAIAQIIIISLIIGAGIIIALWIAGFFFFPSAILAASATVAYMIILALLVVLLVFMSDVMDVHISTPLPGVPAKPSCFPGFIMIPMNDGSYKSIETIQVGDILINHNIVTATFVLDGSHEDIYKIKNTIYVSGSHSIQYNDAWIYVKNHPNAEKTNDKYSSLYCLNTTQKQIEIEGYVFCDWDEILDQSLWNQLKISLSKTFSLHSTHESLPILPQTLYLWCDEGYTTNTMIRLYNGTYKEIQHILLGDCLEENNSILGIVQIWNGEYHLLTKTSTFFVKDKGWVHDYNHCLEQYL